MSTKAKYEKGTPFEMHIHLKSGATAVVDVVTATVRSDKLTGKLTGLEWTCAENGRRLSHIDLNEVVAVVSDFREKPST